MNNVDEAGFAAELAEAKRREEEANRLVAKLAAERAELEKETKKAEEARLARNEEKEAPAGPAADVEDNRKTEAEAKCIEVQSVADAERAAELAEAKLREKKAVLQAAKLEAELAEIQVVTLKAEAEAEAAKALKAEGILKQEKVRKESEKVHKAADKEKKKAEDKEKKKIARKRKKKYRSYNEFSVVKLIIWIAVVLVLLVLLYIFATPVSKGFFLGKNAVDTFLAEKLPMVAQTFHIRGNGHDVPVFKGDSVYLTEDAEDYVKNAVWPQGYRASVVRLNGKQYICVEGNGLKTYYLNEIAENDSKHVYLEKGDTKAMYFKEYSFEKPESLCPVKGVFNTAGEEQYIFSASGGAGMQILDADTLAECRVILKEESIAESLTVNEYLEEEQSVRINMTAAEVPYAFTVMKKEGLSVPDGYKLVFESNCYVTEEQELRFETYVISAGQYLGEIAGKLDYVAGGYVPADVIFYAYADDEYENSGESVIPAVYYKEAQGERFEVIGDRGERLLIPVRTDIPRNEYDEATPTVKGVDVSGEQGRIDWEKVAEAGVEYAMIRVGKRESKENGKCELDAYFKRNAKGAAEAGIGVGVIFVSGATTIEEAREEAQYVLKQIKDYEITWPVALDTTEATHASSLSVQERTACAEAFLKEIAAEGYTAMIYADARWSAFKLDLGQLSGYDLWYNSEGMTMTYPYRHTMQRYSSDGEVPGIAKAAGMNYGFVNYGEQKEE